MFAPVDNVWCPRALINEANETSSCRLGGSERGKEEWERVGEREKRDREKQGRVGKVENKQAHSVVLSTPGDKQDRALT